MQCAVDANQRCQHHGKRKRGTEGSGVAKFINGRERREEEARGGGGITLHRVPLAGLSVQASTSNS